MNHALRNVLILAGITTVALLLRRKSPTTTAAPENTARIGETREASSTGTYASAAWDAGSLAPYAVYHHTIKTSPNDQPGLSKNQQRKQAIEKKLAQDEAPPTKFSSDFSAIEARDKMVDQLIEKLG